MGALVLVVLVCAVVGMVSARVQTHARWHREQPNDEQWLDQLQTFNKEKK